MGLERRPQREFQQNKTGTNKTTLTYLLQRQQKKNIITTDACRTGLGAAIWQKQGNRELKFTAFATFYLTDAGTKINQPAKATGRVIGLERFRFHLYSVQVQFVSDHQSLEPPQRRNKTNKQFSALLTR